MTKTKPDIEFDAEVQQPGGKSCICHCRIWLPQLERSFAIELLTPNGIDLPVPGHQFSISSSADKEADGVVYSVDGIWLKQWTKMRLPAKSPMLNPALVGHVDRIKICHRRLPSETGRVDASTEQGNQLEFQLSSSRYLTPRFIRIPSPTGEVSVSTEDEISVQLSTGRVAKFELRHLMASGDRNSALLWPKLVLNFGPFSESETGAHKPELAMRLADDLCLLASFASRSRVLVEGWSSSTARESEVVLLDPMRRELPDEERHRNDIVVDRGDAAEFLSVALAALQSFTPLRVDAIRLAVAALTPIDQPYSELHYLSMFSALEGVASEYANGNGGRSTFGKKKTWTKIEKALRRCIDEFDSNEEELDRTAMKDKLTELKRAPVGDVFEQLLGALEISNSDLWPLTRASSQEGRSLLDVRNDLAHGKRYSSDQRQALYKATQHLSVTLERVVCRTLNWPLRRTRIAYPPDAANCLGSMAEVEGDMIRLARPIA